MTVKKRIFVIAVALVTLLTAGIFRASAATAAVDSGTCGANLTWVLDSSGVLTISGTGPMTDYDYSGAPWNGHKDSITTVVIGNGVTSIGSSAFWECTNLTSAPIPDSVTKIGGWAFFGCTALTSVNIPAGVTALGNSAFAFCSGMKTLKINGNFSAHHNSFHACTSLTNLKVGAGVTKFAENFLTNLYALSAITVDSGNNTYSDKDGLLLSKDGKTLLFCPLTRSGSLTVPAGVKTIGEMAFFDCKKLTSVTLPNGVTTIGKEAFLHCTKLTSVNIPDSVTEIEGYAFYGCTKLKEMDIPGSVATIGENAFSKCTKLTTVKIPGSVIKLGDCAFLDSGLTDIYYDGTTEQWNQLLDTGVQQLPNGVNVHCKDPAPPVILPLPKKPPASSNSGKVQGVGQINQWFRTMRAVPVAF